jgi:hypothetical protein
MGVIDSKPSLTMKVEKDLTIEAKGKISSSNGGDVEIECNFQGAGEAKLRH